MHLRFGGENGDARIQMLGGVMVPNSEVSHTFYDFSCQEIARQLKYFTAQFFFCHAIVKNGPDTYRDHKGVVRIYLPSKSLKNLSLCTRIYTFHFGQQ